MFVIKNLKGFKSKEEFEKLIQGYLKNRKSVKRELFKETLSSYQKKAEESFDNVTDNLLIYILNNQSLSLEQRKNLLFNKEIQQKLYPYTNTILTKNIKTISLRNKIGITSTDGVIHHILYYSKNGSNKGCGCKLCILKNKNHYISKRVKSIENQLFLLTEIQNVLERSKKEQNEPNKLLDPFENELFERTCSIFLKSRFTDKSKKGQNKEIVRINKKLPISAIEDRTERMKNFLLKEIEKWALKEKKNEDLIRVFKTKTLLP